MDNLVKIMKNILPKIFIVFAMCSISAALLLTPPNQLSKGIPFTFAKVVSDETAIYSTAIKELIINEDVKFLIISNQTVWSKDSTSNLNYNLELPVKYIVIKGADYDHTVLIDEADLKNNEGKPRIMDLFDKYPDAVGVALSKIDFNEEKTEALFYIESFGQGRQM